MIVSDLEGWCVSFLIGAILDCQQRGAYDRIAHHADALFAWCSTPGVTPAAQLEIDAGEEIKRL